MAGSLKLPDCNRTKVFRRLVDRVKAQPDVRRVVRTFREWTGRPDDANELTTGQLPAVQFAAGSAGEEWYDTTSRRTTLVVFIDFIVPGWHLDDALNLWAAIEAAFSLSLPDANDFRQALLADGAFCEEVSIAPPGLAPTRSDATPAGLILGSGQLKIDVFAP